MVPARAIGAARARPSATTTSGATRISEYRDARIIFRRHRAVELDVGSGRAGVLLAPVLPSPAGSQLRQPRGGPRDAGGARLLARSRRGRLPPRRRAVPRRARRHELREPAGDARAHQGDPAAYRRHGARTACCSPKPTSCPSDVRAYFGDGDECHMAYHFPVMPRIFMALHLEDRQPIVDVMEQTPVDSRQLPVGAVPAEPRRAHARDGHRRRARLHVSRLQHGSAGAPQPRHPPAARAARRQQPAAHRAAERAALLVSRHADHLLRRRDRHGRQPVPRRPQRRPHADAVDRRPQRRVLARRSRAPLQPASSWTRCTAIRP